MSDERRSSDDERDFDERFDDERKHVRLEARQLLIADGLVNHGLKLYKYKQGDEKFAKDLMGRREDEISKNILYL